MKKNDILQIILQHKADEVVARKKRISEKHLREKAHALSPPKDFIAALNIKIQQKKPAVIAEVKKASPSKGIIREDFDPIAIAQLYEKAGASCLSILTDEAFFQGNDAYLQQIKRHSSLPILRKDFIIDPYQVYETRALEADCLLLIVAALDDELLLKLTNLARQLGLAVLVECHDEEELQRALVLETPLIGINNRDLKTFQTSLDTTLNLLEKIPPEKIVITESGIHTPEDVACMLSHQVYGFLVGESLMRAEDPGQKLQELFGGR